MRRKPAEPRVADRLLDGLSAGVLGALVVSGIAVSADAVWRETLASRAEGLAAEALRTPAADPGALVAIEALCRPACPARILDAAATIRLAAASALPADRRGPLLSRAARDLERARRAEPRNGAVAIRQAYAASLAPDADAALGLLERSYAVQPFSRTGGSWRVGAVVRRWRHASPALRAGSLREALWLPVTGAYDRDAVAALFDSAGLGLQLDLARSLPPA